MDGVYLAIPRGEWPSPRFWHGIMGLQAWASNRGVRFAFNEVADKNGVSQNHNTLISHFLTRDHEWMLMLDADAMLHPMALERLLSWEKKVVVPVMFRATPPYAPTIHRRPLPEQGDDVWAMDFGWLGGWCYAHFEQLMDQDTPLLLNEVKGDPLIEVKRSGTHVMLVHRDVLEAIEPPWFEPKKPSGTGSDFVFCRKIIEAGYDIWCDRSVFSGHLQGDYCAGVVDWLVWDKITTYSADVDGVQFKLERIGGEDDE